MDKIEESITKDIFKLGYEIEYIEYVKENDNYILRIVIDSLDEKTVDMDACEKVSRKIEDKVDSLMKNSPYVLEISSPGLEREIKNIKLYKKYIGEKVVVKLFKKKEFKENMKLKEFEANIIAVEDNSIILDINGEKYSLDLKEIASCHTYVDFKELFKQNNL